MTKDILSWDLKVSSLIGSIGVVVFPVMILLPEILTGNKAALIAFAMLIGLIDFAFSLKIERLEKHISDLEKK